MCRPAVVEPARYFSMAMSMSSPSAVWELDGSAVAIIRTTGEVYQLADIARFSGIYRKVPAGSVVPGQPSGGLWLQNERATILHLQTPPGGRMPDIGGDAVRVVLK